MVNEVHFIARCQHVNFASHHQEGWIGSLRVLAVYLAGVIAGSLGTSLTGAFECCNLTLTFDIRVENILLEHSFLTDPNTYVAGASGGVYSLIAAHLATVLINWSEDSTVKIRKVY